MKDKSLERKILSYQMVGSDKGDDRYHVLTNGLRKARKQYECIICYGPIEVGELHRAEVQAEDEGARKIMTFRACSECCAAMSVWPTNPDLIDARHSIGFRRSLDARKSVTPS